MRRDALVALPKCPGPFPCRAEHPAVKFPQHLHRQDADVRTSVRPRDGVTDVRRFPRIQLGPRADVRRNQSLDLIFVERRVPFGVEQYITRRVHDSFSSQRRVRRFVLHDSAIFSRSSASETP